MPPQRDLQSLETDTILNTIDELRSQNVGDILELPQIIVCGDQSSGKSSVLNAVSTIKFPTKDSLCTRFATEVIMRPGTPERIMVSIVPGGDRPPAVKRQLEAFRKINVPMDDIANVIGEATETMGIDPRDPSARRFSNDILRFEVTGPEQPSLTLVDLPGLFQSPSKEQTDEDTKLVRNLVLKYMKNKRSVILAVISAKSDFVLQSVTKYSRRVDPHGLRTLGIITKPDKLDEHSESERKFVELAENRSVHLHRGWHVVVNRDYTTRKYTQDQRDDAEKSFLSKGVWSRLPENHKGIFALRTRLSGLLRDQIIDELPNLMQDARNKIREFKDKLSGLGMSRKTPEERRLYLTRASQIFNNTMRSCINGSYDDTHFFEDNQNEHFQQKKLRAVVQNTLVDFTDDMQLNGHAKQIIEANPEEQTESNERDILQSNYEDEVIELMKQNRGRELVGMYNPLILQELFVAQSMPWEDIIRKYQDLIWQAARTTIDLVLQYSTDRVTKMRLKQLIIDPALTKLNETLNDMIRKLLSLHRDKHPITYSPRLVHSIQKASHARAQKVFAQKYAQAVDTRGETVAKNTLQWLFDQQFDDKPTSLERFAASEAIEVMRAYYKIAKETIVDNFSTLAIEDCLISMLPSILSPDTIARMDDERIETIAMETDASASERAEAEDKLRASETALFKLENIVHGRQPEIYHHSSIPINTNLPDYDILEEIDFDDHLPNNIGTDVSKLDLGISDIEDDDPNSTTQDN